MLAAVQGIIQNDMILIDRNELKPYNGRPVTVIINENFKPEESKQDKTKFFNAVGRINLDSNTVNELRAAIFCDSF